MGGNLLVMAQDHPGSRFIGIDSSSRQIADGWKRIDLLGLKNLQLKQMDILDIEDGLGQFDYIISHGVYSWVPAPVQNRMLEICQRHLAPNGVAYISYNTYPGWHVRGLVRDIMLYRGMQFSDPATRLAQAKSLVEFVAGHPWRETLHAAAPGESRRGRWRDYTSITTTSGKTTVYSTIRRRLTVNGSSSREADFSRCPTISRQR